MIVDGIAQVIGNEVTGLTYSESDGSNVFVEHLPKKPNRCVAVYSRPGPEASSLHPYDEPHVQILVRSDEDPRWGLDMWQAIYSVLHAKRYVTLPDGTRLMWALVVQSSPVHLAPDENGRFILSMNVRTETYNPTVERQGEPSS